MAVTSTPVFAQSGLGTTVQVTVANSNLDGATGTYSTAITIGANGAIVAGASFQSAATTTAGTLRIFYADDGATYRLVGEVLQTALVPSAGVLGFMATWSPAFNMVAPAGSKFKFSSTNAETVNCLLIGGTL